MPFKFKKITEIEITDKVIDILRQKIDKNEYTNFDELLDDLSQLMEVFPKKDRIKALGIVGAVTVAITLIINLFVN